MTAQVFQVHVVMNWVFISAPVVIDMKEAVLSIEWCCPGSRDGSAGQQPPVQSPLALPPPTAAPPAAESSHIPTNPARRGTCDTWLFALIERSFEFRQLYTPGDLMKCSDIRVMSPWMSFIRMQITQRAFLIICECNQSEGTAQMTAQTMTCSEENAGRKLPPR